MNLVVGELRPEDVLQMRIVCRAQQADAEPYAIALAFASTRTHICGLSMTISKWLDIWEECTCAVASQGIEASSWGHAIEWVEVEESLLCYDPALVTGSALNPKDAAPCINMMISCCEQLRSVDVAHRPRIATILSLAGCFMDWDLSTSVDVLALCETRYALGLRVFSAPKYR